MLIGFWVAGVTTDSYVLDNLDHDWASIWLYSPAFAIIFAFSFKNEMITYKA